MSVTPPLRVLFVVPQGKVSPGPRYRVFQYLPRLEAMGIEASVAVMQGHRSTLRSLNSGNATAVGRLVHQTLLWFEVQRFILRLLPKCSQFDRVYLYRIPIPTLAAGFLAKHRDRLLFDFDDALDQPELDGTWLQRLRVRFLRRGFANAVQASRVIVTSNQRNAAVVEAMGGRAEVIPTSVDVGRSIVRDRTVAGTPPVLGWIGTPSTARYLVEIAEPLRRVASSRAVSIRLVGAGCSPFPGLPVDLREWRLETECREVSEFDIGLMPMPNTPWTRGKAASKALLYAASGAPTVASWTETNAAILGEDEGTLFCRSVDEWVKALEFLLDNGAARASMGQLARRRVIDHYSLDVQAPRLFRVIAGNSPSGSEAAAETVGR